MFFSLRSGVDGVRRKRALLVRGAALTLRVKDPDREYNLQRAARASVLVHATIFQLKKFIQMHCQSIC